MVIKKYILLILFCYTLLSSCEQNQLKHDAAGNAYREVYSPTTGITERIEFYPDGKVRARGFFKEGKEHGEFTHYYESGKIEETSVYRNGVLEGIYKAFHPNGKLKEKTYYSKGMPAGWSYEYSEKGNKQAAYEYIRFEDDYIGNQRIRYNETGKIIADSSHYMTVSSNGDTISLGEELRLSFKLDAPFYGGNSQVRLLVGGYDEQYRLVNPAETDTIYGNGLNVEYKVLPKMRGRHIVQGRLEDYRIVQLNDGEFESRKDEVYLYFTKSYYVK